MRKYLVNGRILAVVGQYYSRRLWLMMGGGSAAQDGKSLWLCLDLAAGASLHWLEPDKFPTEETVTWPMGEELTSALDQWRQWPVLTPALRRALQPLDEPDRQALLLDLESGGGDVFLYHDDAGKVVQISAWPLPELGRWQESAREDVVRAVQEAGETLVYGPLFEARQKQILAPSQRRMSQIRKLLAKLQGDETRLQRLAAQGGWAQILAANLWRLDKDAKVAQVAIPEASGEGDGEMVPLDRRFSIGENMQRMFRAAVRGKRGLSHLAERRQKLEEELASLQDGATVAPRSAPQDPAAATPVGRPLPHQLHPRVQGFWSSDGYLLLRGKDAQGNAAVRRMAAPHDIWVHVEQGPGAHVIIRVPHPGRLPPERTLEEAGTLAANRSWLRDAATARIMYAEVRHVRPARSGPEGKMIIAKILESMVVPVNGALEGRLLGSGADSGQPG